MAEGVGFEPTDGLPHLLISSQVPLTTQPPFQPLNCNDLHRKLSLQFNRLILQSDTGCIKTKKTKLAPPAAQGEWQKTPFSNLVRYVPSGAYFARIRVGGKLIRQSLKTKPLAAPPATPAAMVDFWHLPVRIQRHQCEHKSLSEWSRNISVGCSHGCRFCYVPAVATKFLKPVLKERYGVDDLGAQWGDYVLLRPFDEALLRKGHRGGGETSPERAEPRWQSRGHVQHDHRRLSDDHLAEQGKR